MSLSEDQRNICETILTKDECSYALSHTKSFKSPGTFWNFLGDSFFFKWLIFVLEKVSYQLRRQLGL